MSTQTQPPPDQSLSLTLRKTLANGTFTLPIMLVFMLIAFDTWIFSYELAFPMKVWMWTTNVGAVMVLVGMCGARVAKERGGVKEA
jgi:hypothetical protein